jgi:uncharacterized protein
MNPPRKLPDVLMIFPLSGALLLPGGRLPLHMFEPRYTAMVRAAYAGERLIAMIQPLKPDQKMAHPGFYPVGCVGEIVELDELEGGTFDIVLRGICRFEVAQELEVTTPYRQVMVNYNPFRRDQEDQGELSPGLRERLMVLINKYMATLGTPLSTRALGKLSDDKLVTALALSNPFVASEKQALLESLTLEERAKTLLSLLSFAVAEQLSHNTLSMH